MIWSFVKVAVFLAIVGVVALIGAHLADSREGIRLVFAGTEYTFGPLQATIAAFILFLLVWVIIRATGLLVAFLRFVSGDNTALGRYFDRNRERKGYQALAEGMLAVASGEGKLALSKAARAERYLHRPELTDLLSAQAAEVAGDRAKATEVYRRLLQSDTTRFVGVQGLMKQKIEEGETETALKLAQKAFALKPDNVDVQDILLKLQTQNGDWKGAREVLSTKRWQKQLPKDVLKRRDAVMALQEARDVFAEGATIEAREAAIAANKASPDLIPAAVLAARAYVEDGKPKQAVRLLAKTWDVQPHPDIAAAYAAIVPDETAPDRLKRFRKLLDLHPDHEENRLLEAELNIAAEDFPAARRALGDLVTTHPTARALTIMAAIERGEGSDDVLVRGWLTRALTAPRGKQWCCDKCQHIQADWAPICENCGGFDTLSWRDPVQTRSPMANGADLLPVIVGKPDRSVVMPDGIGPDMSENSSTEKSN